MVVEGVGAEPIVGVGGPVGVGSDSGGEDATGATDADGWMVATPLPPPQPKATITNAKETLNGRCKALHLDESTLLAFDVALRMTRGQGHIVNTPTGRVRR